MNKEAALASLGLQGNEDHATVARVYGERLAAVQERLLSAQSDADRNTQGAELAKLSEAYEYVTGTGRYTNSSDASATVMRSATTLTPAPSGDTFVRMEPGAVIADRLEIGNLLGQGGMGNVYAARDRLKEEDVAIKVLRQDLQFSIAAKDRFLAEAKVSCSLSHPNIVRVHDVGISGGLYYFSMERLKGHTLRQRMEQYRQNNCVFSIAEVTDIARQLIDALRYAHRYIVHRDIKPENIWLAEDGTVKLMDFGIARAFANSQLTQTGMALGTAYYMSPEQRIGSKEVDWRTDQYALGVVLYELFAGTLPTGAVQPIETLRRDLPKRYAAALMRAMAVMPEDRFQSLNELLAEIEAPPSKKFRYGSIVLIGAGLAAAAAGAFVIVSNQGGAPKLEAAVASAPAAKTTPAPASGSAQSPGAAGTDGAAPSEPPPPSEETSTVAATLPEPEREKSAPAPEQSAADAISATPLPAAPAPSPAPQRVAKATSSDSAPSSASSAGGGIDARRQQCIAQCERDDGECRSLGRRGKQECMRAVAFGATPGRITTTNPAATSCAYFGQSRCDSSFNREACLARMTTRYKACIDVLGGTVAQRRQDCDENARESDQLCLDELRDCRQSCE
ncbi:serine/threonine-protein kinase [Peristeroidobacter agariperforans]|uniref:serine/threonine-protein kinase n=1 Tax=Peristeroidobacter agariperforans TaxID=268404 RepID=UPI001300B94E|nr:serine/threonine-protein kinase [Peristeroidobacter agariperforans]